MKTKKIVSLLLAVLMACSVFTGLTAVSAEEAHTYTVVGDASFLGAAWTPATPADDMALQEDGTYVKTYANVAAGSYQVKVAEDHAWANSFGKAVDNNQNIILELENEATEVKFVLNIAGTKDVTDETTGVTTTVTAAYVTIYVDGVLYEEKVAPEPTETFHVVAGVPELCKGANWDPKSEDNKMTKIDEDTFEITYTDVAAGSYKFKVTTNGAWDKADYNLVGDAKFGGPDAEIEVTEAQAPATVKVTFKESEAHARAYINGVEVDAGETDPTLPPTDNGITYNGGYYAPEPGVESHRYFFEMPASWYTFGNATAACYWWAGTDLCPDWQHSWQMKKANVPGHDIYYIDVPADVTTIVFNNGIDGGQKADPEKGIEASPNWGKNFQTGNIGSEYYEPNENANIPDGTSSFDMMVYVVNEEDIEINDFSGATTYGGEWRFLHADGSVDYTQGTTFDVPPEEVAVTAVEVAAAATAINVGKTTTVTATCTPKDASNKVVTWTTSDASVATVDANGTVKGLKKGTATITATTTDGTNLTASCTITVKQPVTKITLSPTKKTLAVKKTVTLKATVAPSSANTKTVTWTSSNAKIAKVDSKGKVTALKKGTATITCTAKDKSGVKAKCTITVTQPVTKVAIKNGKKVVTGKTVKVKKGKKVTLTAVCTPSNANNKKVTWKTSKKTVATVTSAGKVTAKKVGKATITATAKDGSNKSAKVTINVTKK